MIRKLCGAVLLAACMTCMTGGCGGKSGVAGLEPGAARGHNLLLVTLDTTRADRLGAYGRAAARTPTLDALAADGVRFEHAFTPVPITLPSHATMLTGLLPPRHGVRDNAEYRLAAGADTLAGRLSAAGYATAAFVSAFVLESRYGLDQGFDLYEDRAGFGSGAAAAERILERDATAVTAEAVAWLAVRDPDRPFFLWVHYFDPHQPYTAPEPFASRFADDPYDGEIAYMDSQVGRLLQALARVGARDDTLIVVVADHGEGLGEHGEPTHAMLVYDSVMRVPLIFAGPAVDRAGVVDDAVVSTADILPTTLSMLGVVDDGRRDGLDLATERPAADRAVYLESLTPYLHHGWSPLFALHRLDDKYIEAPIPEYYDLTRDPGETANLDATATPGSILQGRDALKDQLGRMLEDWPSYAEAAEAAATLDTDTLERLRALGYVGGGAPVDPTLEDPKEMMGVLQRIHRANALLRAGRHEDAIAELQQARELSPRDRTVLQTLGAVHLMLGHEREAEVAMRQYIAIRPAAEVCALLAQIRLNSGTTAGRAEARALLDQATALDPEYGLAWLTRGDLLSREGDHDGAVVAWESAARHDPTLGGAARSRIARADRR